MSERTMRAGRWRRAGSVAGWLAVATLCGLPASSGCDSPRSTAVATGTRAGAAPPSRSTRPSSVAVARSTTTASVPETVTDYCRSCAPPVSQGALADERIDEASGLVASRAHPGVYYVHADSGDTARFFAIDVRGTVLGIFELRGGTAVDWEDAALGPCPQGNCVYFADIGDNHELRADYALYRVPEPAMVGPGTRPVSFERLPFAYPDGSHNAETLLAHPTTGELAIVTKVATGPCAAYRFPLPLTPETTVTLVKIAELQAPTGTALVTGGDVHPGGRGILLRTYTNLFFAPIRDGTLASALLGSLCVVPVATETQGESVAWTAAGDGWVTVSEGVRSPIYATSCRAP